MSLNRITTIVFSLVLIGSGAAGFFPAPATSSVSAALPYNVFHIVFGVIGVGCFFWGKESVAKTFNIGFGLIDVYQGFAALGGWFPGEYFHWKTMDTILHFVLGAALVVIGLLSVKFQSEEKRPK